MNYYPHHIGDYRRDTAHLSLLEHGVYRQLIDWYYLDESPIPAETQQVMRRLSAKTQEEQNAVICVLNDFFEKTETGFRHERCENELEFYKNRGSTSRQNGKLGGRPKKITNKNKDIQPTETQQVILGNPYITQEKGNQEPITNNQEPITKNKKSKKPLSTSVDVEEVFEYWKMIMNSPTAKLDAKRITLITNSLKLGYSTSDLRSAIDGCRKTPHNMGDNDRQTKYNGLGLILRSAEYIDRFMSTNIQPARLQVPNETNYNRPASRGDFNAETERQKQLSKSAAGRVQLNAEREARQGAHNDVVATYGADVRPQMDQ